MAGGARTHMARSNSLTQWTRALVPYVVLIAVGVALGGWAAARHADWGVDDWIALLYATFLSFGLIFVGRRQQRLREALANLELQEKVGVIKAAALRATEKHDPMWCLYVASDARAALHLFRLAGVAQQQDLLGAIALAFANMRETGVTALLDGRQLECLLLDTEALHDEMFETISSATGTGRYAIDQVRQLRDLMQERQHELASPIGAGSIPAGESS